MPEHDNDATKPKARSYFGSRILNAEKGGPGWWMDQIDKGIRYREKYGESKRWAKWWSYYRCKWPGYKLPVNMIKSMVSSAVPQVYFRDPRIELEPSHGRLEGAARVLTALDNRLLRLLDIKRQIRYMALDAYLYGTGISKIGIDTKYGLGTFGTLMEYDKRGRRLEQDATVVPAFPWMARSSPFDFVVPWGTQSVDSARWMAFRVIRHIDDIKADRRYSEARKKVSAGTFSTRGRDDSMHQSTELVDYTELWEIHDAWEGRVLVIGEGVEDPLFDEEDLLQTRYGLPADALCYDDEPDFFWAPSPVGGVEADNIELNDIRAIQRKHRFLSVMKFLYHEGAIDDDELQKILDGEVKAAVKFKRPLNEGSYALFQPTEPPGFEMASRYIQSDARATFGLGRNQMGDFDVASRRTAHEASLVQQGSDVRMDDQRDRVVDVLLRNMNKINQLIFDYWDTPTVVDVVGPDGAQHWVEFTGKSLRGDFYMRAIVEDAQQSTPSVRRSEAAVMMDKLIAAAQAAQALQQPLTVNIGAALRYFLEQFHQIDPNKFLQPQMASSADNPMSMDQFGQLQGANVETVKNAIERLPLPPVRTDMGVSAPPGIGGPAGMPRMPVNPVGMVGQ